MDFYKPIPSYLSLPFFFCKAFKKIVGSKEVFKTTVLQKTAGTTSVFHGKYLLGRSLETILKTENLGNTDNLEKLSVPNGF